MIQFITLVKKKKASNWTWVSGRRLNFPQWINNLSRSDGEVASISWKSNDECMQVKSGARKADYLYIFEFHKSNSKLQLSLKKVFKRKSIPKMYPYGSCRFYWYLEKKVALCWLILGPSPLRQHFVWPTLAWGAIHKALFHENNL